MVRGYCSRYVRELSRPADTIPTIGSVICPDPQLRTTSNANNNPALPVIVRIPALWDDLGPELSTRNGGKGWQNASASLEPGRGTAKADSVRESAPRQLRP